MLEILLMGKPRPLAIPTAAQADLQAVQELAQSRSSSIPADFHQIFAETEFMLWGRDQDDAPTTVEPAHIPPAAAAPPSTPLGGPAPASAPFGPAGRPAVAASSPFGTSATTDMTARPDRLDIAARTASGGLSAIEDSGLDDTDSRQASGWVRWLQAQGARSLDRSGRRPSASGPVAGSVSDAFPMAAAATGGLPMTGAASGGLPMSSSASGGFPMSASPSGRLPLADSASGGVPMSAPPNGGLPAAGFGGDVFPMPMPASAGLPMSSGASGGLSLSDAVPEHSPEDLRDMFAQFGPTPPRAFDERPSDPLPGATPPPADFFAPQPDDPTRSFDTVQGAGTLMAGDAGPNAPYPTGPHDPLTSGPASENASRWGFEDHGRDYGGLGPVDLGLDTSTGSPGGGANGYTADYHESAPSPAALGGALPRVTSDQPAATGGDGDFAAQLTAARAHGAAGALPQALEEYRAILRGSSDHLGDIVSDLQSLAAGTDNAEVHRLLGDARIRQGDYVGALESYNRAQALTQEPGA
jgi:hypothetical protein